MTVNTRRETQKSQLRYIFIPEEVRFDRRLKPMAMMIFGEIYRLCLENGGSTNVRNADLAVLYDRDVQTVSEYVVQLVSLGYLRAEMHGIRRRLYPTLSSFSLAG